MYSFKEPAVCYLRRVRPENQKPEHWKKSAISEVSNKETVSVLENSSCSYLHSARPETLQINVIWILYYVYPLLPRLKPGTESDAKYLT